MQLFPTKTAILNISRPFYGSEVLSSSSTAHSRVKYRLVHVIIVVDKVALVLVSSCLASEEITFMLMN